MAESGSNINEVKVDKGLRLGKKQPLKPRLLLISVSDFRVKMSILKAAKRLKTSTQLNNVYITPDLTHKEREQSRNFRAELKCRRDIGEKNLVMVVD